MRAVLIERPHQVDWVELDTEPGRRALEDAMNAVAHALRSIGREQNGRDNLRRIARVTFSKGRQMAALFPSLLRRITPLGS